MQVEDCYAIGLILMLADTYGNEDDEVQMDEFVGVLSAIKDAVTSEVSDEDGSRRNAASAAIDELDTDGDGYISLEEMQAASIGMCVDALML